MAAQSTPKATLGRIPLYIQFLRDMPESSDATISATKIARGLSLGRSTGKNAVAKAKNVTVGKLSLSHVEKFEKEIADAKIETDLVSPKLLPNYTNQKSI